MSDYSMLAAVAIAGFLVVGAATIATTYSRHQAMQACFAAAGSNPAAIAECKK